MEQPKQEHETVFQNQDRGGVPLEQQTTTHRKDGRVTPCVSYGTVADKAQKLNFWETLETGLETSRTVQKLPLEAASGEDTPRD